MPVLLQLTVTHNHRAISPETGYLQKEISFLYSTCMLLYGIVFTLQGKHLHNEHLACILAERTCRIISELMICAMLLDQRLATSLRFLVHYTRFNDTRYRTGINCNECTCTTQVYIRIQYFTLFAIRGTSSKYVFYRILYSHYYQKAPVEMYKQ